MQQFENFLNFQKPHVAIRVKPEPMSSSINVQNNQITISNSGSSQRYIADQVFQQTYNNQQIFNEYQLKLQQFIEGYNVSFVLLGSSNSNRSQFLLGSNIQKGFLELFLNSSFQIIEEKKYLQQNQFSFQFNIQAYILDEYSQDLFKSSLFKESQGIYDQNQTFGKHLNGIKVQILNSSQINQLSQQIQLVYNQQKKDSSCLLIDIQLLQTFDNQQSILNSAAFIILPEIETENNSFQKLIQSFKQYYPQDNIFYYDVLQKYIFKYYILNIIIFVQSSQYQKNLQCLNLISYMNQMKLYPIVTYINVYKHINFSQNQQNTDTLNQQDIQDNLSQALNLQQQLNQMKNEQIHSLTIQDLNAIKGKYNELLDNNQQLLQKNIQCNQEKLEISQMVVDLQIENCNLQKQFEQEKFQMQEKILTDENKMVETEVENQKINENLQEMQIKLEEKEDNLKEIQQEYFTIKRNYQKIFQENENLIKEKENLGIELISMIQKYEKLEHSNVQFKDFQINSNINSTERDKIIDQYKQQLIQLQNELDQTINQNNELKMKLELNSKNQVEPAQSKVQMDSTMLEMQRIIDVLNLELKDTKEELENTNQLNSKLNISLQVLNKEVSQMRLNQNESIKKILTNVLSSKQMQTQMVENYDKEIGFLNNQINELRNSNLQKKSVLLQMQKNIREYKSYLNMFKPRDFQIEIQDVDVYLEQPEYYQLEKLKEDNNQMNQFINDNLDKATKLKIQKYEELIYQLESEKAKYLYQNNELQQQIKIWEQKII